MGTNREFRILKSSKNFLINLVNNLVLDIVVYLVVVWKVLYM